MPLVSYRPRDPCQDQTGITWIVLVSRWTSHKELHVFFQDKNWCLLLWPKGALSYFTRIEQWTLKYWSNVDTVCVQWRELLTHSRYGTHNLHWNIYFIVCIRTFWYNNTVQRNGFRLWTIFNQSFAIPVWRGYTNCY